MEVSVAMCTYNGEKYIREQIESILNQTKKVSEIMICDDGSTDNTIEILTKYSNDNPNLFKIIQNQINLKSVKNFEKAISLCTGEIIFLADQDDIWCENKVAEFCNYFTNNPQIKAISSNGYCINEHSEILEKYAVWDIPSFIEETGNNVDYFKLITCGTNIATGASMAIKNDFVSEIIPFPIISEFHHDEWIAIVASKNQKYFHFSEKYFQYRIHDSQQVGGVFFDKTPAVKKMLTALYINTNTLATFKFYKKKLKNLCLAHQKNLAFYNFDQQKFNFAKENIFYVQQKYEQTKREMKKKYLLASIIMSVTDKLSNKRQLKKLNFDHN